MGRQKSNPLVDLQLQLRAFARARDWDQFHAPKNLAMAMASEVGELLEHFQWVSLEESSMLPLRTRVEVERELADVFIYLIRIADKLDIDLLVAARKKIVENARKYPVQVSRGSSKKYTHYKRRRRLRSK